MCCRVRRSRVVLTPLGPASSLREEAQATVPTKPGHRGEHEVSRKTIARGMPGRSGVTVVTMLVCLFYFACEAAGALSARHSLRPLLLGEANEFLQTSGESRREIAESYVKSVILRCEPCGALAPLGEPRRMGGRAVVLRDASLSRCSSG